MADTDSRVQTVQTARRVGGARVLRFRCSQWLLQRMRFITSICRSPQGRLAMSTLSGGAVLLAAGSAYAQAVTGTAAGPPKVAPGAAIARPKPAARALESIIVTARRRREALQAVPVAVNVFGAKDLRANNITSSQDLARFVPSLQINNSSAGLGSGYVLRGQSTTFGGGPGVVAYFAEVPLIDDQTGEGTFQGGLGPGQFFDLQDIEVLKGPQGTLFGRNTTGGAILFSPQKPTDNLQGYLQVTGGSYDWREFEGAINVPLVKDVLSLRVATDISMRDGYTTDVGPYFYGRDYDNRNYQAYRFSLAYDPSADFRNDVVVNSRLLDQNGPGSILTAVNPHGLDLTEFPQLNAFLAQQQARGPRETESSADQADREWTFAAIDTARWTLDNGMALTNIAAYQVENNSSIIQDFDGTPFAIQDEVVPKKWSADGDQYSDEIQLSGVSLRDRLTWTAGLYTQYSKPDDQPEFDVHESTPVAPGVYLPITVVARETDIQKNVAPYAQGTFDLAGLSPLLQGFHATAGIRYTVDERAEQSDIYIPTFRNACAETTGAFPHCNLDASGQFAAPTWTLALDYRLDPGTLLYVTARRGFKNGGFNLNAPADSAESTFKPETVNDVEIGLKSDWHVLGAAFRTDFDAYRAQYDDAQRPVTVLINGLPAAVTENAASATIEGIELEETIIPVRDTTLSVSYAYTCSRYDKYVSPVLGNLSGLPFPFTPANKLSVSWRYRLPVAGDLGVVTLGAIYSYQSSMNAGPDFSPTNVIPGYGLVNLRLDWDNIAGGPWKASIFVTNATDKLYITKTFGEYTAFGVAVVNYGEPRIIGAQLRYEF